MKASPPDSSLHARLRLIFGDGDKIQDPGSKIQKSSKLQPPTAAPASAPLLRPAVRGARRHGRPLVLGIWRFLGSWILVCGVLSILTIVNLPAADTVNVAGITEPFLDVTLSASVAGIVTSRNFKEGDFVQEGQLLLELDQKLDRLEVDRRRLVRDQKMKDYEGTKKLFSSTRGVSKEELDKKEVEYRVAAVEHDMAAEQLRHRRLVSPLSGTISEILIEVGESCTPYQALVRVVDTRRCYFITNVEARQAARLKTGQTLKLEIESGSIPLTVPAQISFLSPVVDPASGLRRVKLLFDNPDGRVVPGVAGRLLFE